MIIFMAGYPQAGKTFILDKALEKVDKEVMVICPKDFRDDDYDKIDENEKRTMNIAAWEASLEILWESMQIKENEIIIYDTACASLRSMRPYFEGAKKFGHKVVYVFINTKPSIRKERSKDNLMSNDIIMKYKYKFTESIIELTRISDHYVIINNDADVPDVSKLVELMV